MGSVHNFPSPSNDNHAEPLEEHAEPDSASAALHSPPASPGAPYEAIEKAPEDEDVRVLASAYEGLSSSPTHSADDEEFSDRDWTRMSQSDIQSLKRQDLRRSLIETDPDTLKQLKAEMTPRQLTMLSEESQKIDEEAGIEPVTHQQQPAQQQPLRPPARTGPNKLRKDPPPGYVPPDYTEYKRLQGTPPRPGQGVLSRAAELKAAKNKARGELFPRINAVLDVATSATALGMAATKKAKDVKEATTKTAKDVKKASSDLISKLQRRGGDGDNS
jgi:hypothetical protein